MCSRRMGMHLYSSMSLSLELPQGQEQALSWNSCLRLQRKPVPLSYPCWTPPVSRRYRFPSRVSSCPNSR